MVAKTLTAAGIARLRPIRGKQREIPDAACRGLYLVVGGVKSWALRYRRPGSNKSAKLVLGRVAVDGGAREEEPVVGATLTLASARRLAAKLSHEIAQGRDPAVAQREERRRTTEALTFSDAAV